MTAQEQLIEILIREGVARGRYEAGTVAIYPDSLEARIHPDDSLESMNDQTLVRLVRDAQIPVTTDPKVGRGVISFSYLLDTSIGTTIDEDDGDDGEPPLPREGQWIDIRQEEPPAWASILLYDGKSERGYVGVRTECQCEATKEEYRPCDSCKLFEWAGSRYVWGSPSEDASPADPWCWMPLPLGPLNPRYVGGRRVTATSRA